MKKLLWDIETSKMTVRTFSLYPERINHDDIIKDWHIISVAYKWVGEDKVHVLRKRGKDDDSKLVERMRKVLEKADLVIHHNGDKFDYPKFLSRMIELGLPPLPKLKTYDTLKAARKAGFTSKRLDYLLRVLLNHGKLDNPKGLWNDATDGCPVAIRQMCEYNKNDVILLEELYEILKPYNLISHPNENVYNDDEVEGCPHCGHSELIKRGYNVTRLGKYQRYQCLNCNGWSQGKTNLIGSVNIR